MGLVLEGSVTIESNDASGNRTIISRVGRGWVTDYLNLERSALSKEPGKMQSAQHAVSRRRGNRRFILHLPAPFQTNHQAPGGERQAAEAVYFGRKS